MILLCQVHNNEPFLALVENMHRSTERNGVPHKRTLPLVPPALILLICTDTKFITFQIMQSLLVFVVVLYFLTASFAQYAFTGDFQRSRYVNGSADGPTVSGRIVYVRFIFAIFYFRMTCQGSLCRIYHEMACCLRGWHPRVWFSVLASVRFSVNSGELVN